jgi:hypothetical protein
MLNDARPVSEPVRIASDAPRARQLTLADLVAAVASESQSDAEVTAVVTHMIQSGAVRLAGEGRRLVIDRG